MAEQVALTGSRHTTGARFSCSPVAIHCGLAPPINSARDSVPLITIANLMGHVTPETTVGSYVHCLDYLQHQQMQAHLDDASDALWFSFETFGALIGIGLTGVLTLIKRYEQTTGSRLMKHKIAQIHSAWREGRGDRILLSLSDAANLMIFHLCLVQSVQNLHLICQ